jgi:hypothetical protein
LWIDRTYDLSAFAGEPVRIFFMVSNDGVGGNIAMYVDDVSVLACHTPQEIVQNEQSAVAQAQPPAVSTNTAQRPPTFTPVTITQPPQNTPEANAPFGRFSGLLAVLGIAGALLLIFPFSRRPSQ